MDPSPKLPAPVPPPEFDDVGLFGLSFRGYLTFLLATTCCLIWIYGAVSGTKTDVPPALLALTSVTITFYFKR